MSEWYNDPMTPEELSGTPPTEEQTETHPTDANEEVAAVPTAEEAVEPTPVAQPQPPVPPQAPPYGAPARPPYTPPYNSYGAPRYGGYGTPPAPMPPKRSGGSTAAIAILAVLCCVSLLVSGILAVMLVANDDDGDRKPQTSNGGYTQNDDDREVNEDGPTLEISDIDETSDGGLTTREIVQKNLDAAVVLTMYTESVYGGYFGFDTGEESGLTQAGGASGIILSEDGYIITNSHCVYDEESGEEFARIDVSLYDGRVYEDAEIIG